ncbi:MAG: oligosaccharide flippase family protein [Acidobacteria bacterium]|nr:oligosaccharide flippase family protein [Acidobacteriota bacterium]
MAWNVLASWVGHFVFVVAGFILPRAIDSQIGQAGLGVWDFGWSLVNYLTLTQVGVGSSVSPSVARARAQGDAVALNRAVSSVLVVQLVIAAITAAITVVLALYVPVWFRHRLGGFTADVGWLVLFLGLSLAAQQAGDTFAGVTKGCHRWDLHNGLNAGTYAVTVAVMLVALSSGGGLLQIALIHFAVGVVGEVFRIRVAYVVCPELSLSGKQVFWSEAWGMLRFGGKTLLMVLSNLLLHQTVNVLIVAHLGTTALAVYARPMALLRHVATLVGKYGYVLTPTVSSLEATGKRAELKALFLESGRNSTFLSLPAVVFLAVMGGPLLHAWMGPEYAAGTLVAILALGMLVPLSQTSVWHILVGVDSHGRPAAATLASAIAGSAAIWFGLAYFDAGLNESAVVLGLASTLTSGGYLTWRACRRLDVPVGSYLVATWRQPVLSTMPFLVVLGLVRFLFEGSPLAALVVGTCCGGPIVACAWWRHLLPGSVKRQLLCRAGRVWGRFGRNVA